jgi:hypothetical protein
MAYIDKVKNLKSYLPNVVSNVNDLLGRPDPGAVDLSINNILNNINAIVTPSRYGVMIGDGKMNILAHTVTLPARTIQSRDDNTYVVGKTIKTPYATDVSELSISFYVNHNGKSKKDDNLLFFENWASGTSPESIIYNKPDGKSNSYVRFADDFAKNNIMINQYAANGDIINTWIFIQAYPTSVSYSQLAYAAKDQIFEVTVGFNIVEYHSINVPFFEMSSSAPVSYPLDTLPPAMRAFAGGDAAGFQVKPDSKAPSKFAALGEIGKKMTKNAVRQIVKGQPVDLTSEIKNETANYTGDMVAGVVEDPAQAELARSATQAAILEQPNKLNRSSRKATENRIFGIIDSL